MYWQFDATPQPCAGSPASASTQAGSTVPPRTANNSAVQNQSQFDYGPSQLHPRDRVPSEDDQAPQHYRGPATSTPSIARALVPPPTASNATVQNQNWNHLDDHPSQLPLCGQLSSEDNQVPQRDLGPSPGGPTLYPATVSLPTSSHARNQYPNQFGNYPPQHRSGSSTGTIGLPLVTANNVAVQNRNQFGDYPSQLHLYGQISSEDNPTLQFYVGPQTSSYTLTGAIDPSQASNNATNQNQFTNCHSHLCLYIQDGDTCGELITCDTVPEHFRAMHGVKGLPRDFMIFCEWQNCESEVRRHNFVRHIREKHLKHERT